MISVDALPKGRRRRGQKVKKCDRSKECWSSSTFEMDDTTVQPQTIFSTVSQPIQTSDPKNSGGSQSVDEFVNHGYMLWCQTRQQWLRNKRSQNQRRAGEATISRNASYDSLLGTHKPFERPIPLCEMVDFLVDIWELEGLYE